MNVRIATCVAVVAGAAAVVAFSGRAQPPAAKPEAPAAGDAAPDRDAVLASSRAFAAAFNAGDARAVAALWSERGEYQDDAGETLQGRAAIESAFAAFFKANPGVRIEVRAESVRFPAPGVAIEEGILRQTGPGKRLPTSTAYSTTLVREGERWLVAVSRESGSEQDRLEDLDWLLGTWTGTVADGEVTLRFTRDPDKPAVLGTFTRSAGGKVTGSGTMRIAVDPQTGMLRSWHFDDDGGHGQAVWGRDGRNWVLDAAGTTADGTETTAVNVLGRVSDDAITWRSIDRTAGDRELPDTVPVRLTRAPAAKN